MCTEAVLVNDRDYFRLIGALFKKSAQLKYTCVFKCLISLYKIGQLWYMAHWQLKVLYMGKEKH